MTLVDGSLESPWSTSYSPSLNIFSVYYDSGSIRRNVYSSAVFAAGRPLSTQILPEQGRPLSTILSTRKLDTGLPSGEDRILVRSLVLTIPECDGRTDGRICLRAVKEKPRRTRRRWGSCCAAK